MVSFTVADGLAVELECGVERVLCDRERGFLCVWWCRAWARFCELWMSVVGNVNY